MTTQVQRSAGRFAVGQAGDGTGFWMQDCRMTILASTEDTAGQLGVVYIVAPPGHEPPLHVHHDEDEAYFILSGRLAVRCGGQEIDALPGTWVNQPRGIAHTLRVTSEEPARWLEVVTPGGFESFFRDLGTTATRPGLPVPMPPDLERVGRLFARHHVEVVGPPPGPAS